MFWIGKVIGVLLHPLRWIIILLAISVFSKNVKRKSLFAIATLLSFVFFSNSWIITNLMAPFHDPPNPMKANEKYEIGILLGGITNYDRSSKEGYFNISSDRFIQTALLYKKGYIRNILVSGGQNGIFKEDNFSEAGFIKKHLMDLGIPPENILIEETSKNTIENAKFCKDILKKNKMDNKSVVLITSAFHMQRAKTIFEQEGYKIRPFPCAFSILPGATNFKLHHLLPTTKAMDWWHIFLKELIGQLYYKMSR